MAAPLCPPKPTLGQSEISVKPATVSRLESSSGVDDSSRHEKITIRPRLLVGAAVNIEWRWFMPTEDSRGSNVVRSLLQRQCTMHPEAWLQGEHVRKVVIRQSSRDEKENCASCTQSHITPTPRLNAPTCPSTKTPRSVHKHPPPPSQPRANSR